MAGYGYQNYEVVQINQVCGMGSSNKLPSKENIVGVTGPHFVDFQGNRTEPYLTFYFVMEEK